MIVKAIQSYWKKKCWYYLKFDIFASFIKNDYSCQLKRYMNIIFKTKYGVNFDLF